MSYNVPQMNVRVYLHVPFNDKDEAKDLGCRWDGDRKNGIVLIAIMAKAMFLNA